MLDPGRGKINFHSFERKMTKMAKATNKTWDGKSYSGGSPSLSPRLNGRIFLARDTFMNLSTRKRPAKCKTMKTGGGKGGRTRSRAQGMRVPFTAFSPVVSNFSLALPLFPSARWWISVGGYYCGLRDGRRRLKQYPDTGWAAPQNHSLSLPLTRSSTLLKHASALHRIITMVLSLQKSRWGLLWKENWSQGPIKLTKRLTIYTGCYL